MVTPEPDPVIHRMRNTWGDTRGSGERPSHAGWGGAQADATPYDEALRIGGQGFDTGIGVLSNSRLEVRNAGHGRFEAKVGVDDSTRNTRDKVVFYVYGDGKLLAQSPALGLGDRPSLAERRHQRRAPGRDRRALANRRQRPAAGRHLGRGGSAPLIAREGAGGDGLRFPSPPATSPRQPASVSPVVCRMIGGDSVGRRAVARNTESDAARSGAAMEHGLWRTVRSRLCAIRPGADGKSPACCARAAAFR
ncbi:NPCBM/NEW2 domain-containing protein [Caulobacter segnis]